MRRTSLVVCALLAGCALPPGLPPPPPGPPPVVPPPRADAPVDEPVPALRLPADVRPLSEALEMHLDPRHDRYAGAADIDVQLLAARKVIWLHGKGLNVTRATVTPEGGPPVDAVWQARDPSGFAALSLAGTAPAGRARLHLEWNASYGRGQHGLYRAREAGVDYVFTQFEPTVARQAFPCFDEPGFKIPFTTTLVVPKGQEAIANTHEVSRSEDASGGVRVTFAPTAALPSYLVAFAVGPFDVVPAPDVPPNAVRTRPVPLRGVAPRGRGREMAYALAHAGELLAALEGLVGMEYPFDKLDFIAVPGKGGAMENAGAITFGEPLVLFDEASASVQQRRSYAAVVAHELAHQWTGDLVTLAWWDETWLNEAFASWLGPAAADLWNPAQHHALGLVQSAQYAMGVDALASARAVRQPITSTDDIENAFDPITYSKGAAVLSMFQRWAGAAAWQKGLHAYLAAHAGGNATADDFLRAENDATGKDVLSAMHTFLDQPGVPLVEATLECSPGAGAADGRAPRGGSARVALRQSRFVPLGGVADASSTWQIPVCVRTDRGAACTLLAEREGSLDLGPGAPCPAFVLPNADGAGYYRFALGARDLDALRTRGLPVLDAREKLAYATSLRSAFSRGTTSFADVLRAVAPLAGDAEPAVAEEPMGYLTQARMWLFADVTRRAAVERHARDLYAKVARRLGWVPREGEDDETRALRASVLRFLATTGLDPAVRAEARRRGRAYVAGGKIHPEAVDANLAQVALTVVGEEADGATWDALLALLRSSEDEAVRGRLLRALASARDPALAVMGRDLVLEPSLRDTEVLVPLYVQAGRDETRDAAIAWLEEHFEAVVQRVPRHRAAARLFGVVGAACGDEQAREIEAFYRPRASGIEGGPRELSLAVEGVRLCAARRRAHEAGARDLFGKPGRKAP